VVREPETAERRCQKKFKFLTQDSEKVYCRDAMQKKTKLSVCADETGQEKKKNYAKEKFCASCIPHTAARKWQKNVSLLRGWHSDWSQGSSVGL
jgi:hypothetical protein